METTREMRLALTAMAAAAGLTEAVRQAGGAETLMKEDVSPVTVADYAAQAFICRMIQQHFPQDAVIAEEHSSSKMLAAGFSEALVRLFNEKARIDADMEEIAGWIDYRGRPGSGRCWIIDPVDGTKGFLRGGQYAIALALLSDGKIQAGFLGCPNLSYDSTRQGCIFSARRGGGAWQHWLKDTGVCQPVHVSGHCTPDAITFAESVESAHTDHGFHQRLYQYLGVAGEALRLDSQAKYAVVARGDASAYIRMQSKTKPEYRQRVWDHAAGVVLVQAAGGKVTDCNGKDLDFSLGKTLAQNEGVLATNGRCHDQILEALSTIAGS